MRDLGRLVKHFAGQIGQSSNTLQVIAFENTPCSVEETGCFSLKEPWPI